MALGLAITRASRLDTHTSHVATDNRAKDFDQIQMISPIVSTLLITASNGCETETREYK